MYVAIFMGPGPGIAPADERAVIDLCIEQAVAAARAGFSLITFGEQHFNGYEPYCNPLMMGARLAPDLGRSYFGTTVCPLPFHHPLRLAENINLLDVLTRGQLIVGLSGGRPSSGPGMPTDFTSFAVDVADREAIFEVKLAVMLDAWKQRRDMPPLKIDTPWDKGELAGQLMPASYRDGHPILAIGANADASVIRAATRRWPLFLGPCPREEAVTKFALYRRHLAEAGADADETARLTRMSLVARSVIVGETDAAAWARAETLMGGLMNRRGDPRSLYALSQLPLAAPETRADPLFPIIRLLNAGLICGSPDSVTEQLLFYPRHGIEQVHTRFPVISPFDPALAWESFNLFVEAVMPRLNPQTFPPGVARATMTGARPGGGLPVDRRG